MQFIDLAKQQRRIKSAIDRRIADVLRHGHYVMGPEVIELEDALREYTGARHCISCASGTNALLMVLLAWGVGRGDAVFVPNFTVFAVAEVVSILGATPILVDIEPDTFNISPRSLTKAIQAVKEEDPQIYPLPVRAMTKQLTPKAIVAVDLFGQAADYEIIKSIADSHDLLLLEDAAQSFGGTYADRKNCALGCNAAATSFSPANPLGCYGDGGAIFTDDENLSVALRSLRLHGKGVNKHDNVRVGLNSRLDTIQAGILLAKLEVFEQEIASRQRVAGWYEDMLHRVPGVFTPIVRMECKSAWAHYSILLAEGLRDKVVTHLSKNGVPTNIYYPRPLHQLDVFKSMKYNEADFPVSTASSRNILALPFHPYMTDDEANYICNVVAEAVDG